MPNTDDRNRFGLPPKMFLYTLDQIATMLELPVKDLRSKHIYYYGRSIGARQHHLMVAHNIAAEGEKPDWRVAEREFIRWLRHKGFTIYHRGILRR